MNFVAICFFFIFYFLFPQCSNRFCFQCHKDKTKGPRVTKFGVGQSLVLCNVIGVLRNVLHVLRNVLSV